MIPPKGPSGLPTVSATQLRTYGAGGFRLEEQEQERGCPRLYRAKYVERRVRERRGYALAFGSFFHEVLYLMERDGLVPDEALEKAFPVDGTPEMWSEARDDLTKYLERGASPTDRYATIAVETELDALLFEDEQFGPIQVRGIIDWLGIDPDDPTVLHVTDYKTNRSPPTTEDVRGDVQLKLYAFLARENWRRFGFRTPPRVVVHLDAVKWRDVEVSYTDRAIDDWHSWVTAVVRRILRDDKGEPVLNPGCSFCPVNDDCPAYAALPQTAAALSETLPMLDTPLKKLEWRDAANGVRLLLENAVKKVDAEFKEVAARDGQLQVGDQEWVLETDWQNVVDVRMLHRVLGDLFYEVASASKSAIEKTTKDASPDLLAAARDCITREPTGSKVTRRKVKR